jgi:hypothetical protein
MLKAKDAWAKWNAVFNFLLRSYWSRVWIIQELARGQNILTCCCRDVVPWKCLSAVFVTIEDVVNTRLRIKLPKPAPSREDWATMLSGICDSHPLLLDRQRAQGCSSHAFDANILLGISQKSACSNSRDRIYGLLGIIANTEMPVDYTNDIFQLYGDMIQYINHDEVRGAPLIRDFLTVRFSQCAQALLRGPHPNGKNLLQYITAKCICGDTICTIGLSYNGLQNGAFSIDNHSLITNIEDDAWYSIVLHHQLPQWKKRRDSFHTWSKYLAVGPAGIREGDRFVSFMMLATSSSYARERMIDTFW